MVNMKRASLTVIVVAAAMVSAVCATRYFEPFRYMCHQTQGHREVRQVAAARYGDTNRDGVVSDREFGDFFVDFTSYLAQNGIVTGHDGIMRYRTTGKQVGYHTLRNLINNYHAVDQD